MVAWKLHLAGSYWMETVPQFVIGYLHGGTVLCGYRERRYFYGIGWWRPGGWGGGGGCVLWDLNLSQS